MKPLLYACRRLRRSPAFTVTSVISLALGIGANTAMFSLIDALLLRPLPVVEPHRLVQLGAVDAAGRVTVLPTPVVDLIRRERIFQSVCAFMTPLSAIAIEGRISPRSAMAMSGDCFETLGIVPALGRVLGPADDEPSAPRVTMISYDSWHSDFGGRLDVLGQQIGIEGYAATVVGVTPRSFSGVVVGYPAQAIFPLGLFEEYMRPFARSYGYRPVVNVFARLNDGDSLARVDARVQSIWPRLLEASLAREGEGSKEPDERARYLAQRISTITASTGLDYSLRARFTPSLLALLVVAAIVLLVSCANVANLLLARASFQRRELAVRLALGASRATLVHDALVESVLLVVSGAAMGVVMAYWSNAGVLAMFRAGKGTFSLDVTPDARILLFTSVVAGVAFLLFAVIPAWTGTRSDGRDALCRASGRVHGDKNRLRRTLVVAQVALALTLVVSAWQFATVFAAARAVPLGLNTESVLSAQIGSLLALKSSARASSQDTTRELLRRVARIPGVRTAALSTLTPLASRVPMEPVAVTGRELGTVQADHAGVTEGFLATMGIPLVAGRDFGREDALGTPRTAIISESLAWKLFARRTPLGEQIDIGRNATRTLTIVGIARDAIITRPQAANTYAVYQNFWQAASPAMPTVVLSTTGDSRRLIDVLRHELQVDERIYPARIRLLDDDYDAALAEERLLMGVSSAFGILGLTLAAVGLYGLLALSVARRAGEIGIRLALGADRLLIVRLVVREASVLLLAGLALGLPLAWGASNAARALIPSVAPLHLSVLVSAVSVLVVTGIMAACVPAWRACSTSPLEALRRE